MSLTTEHQYSASPEEQGSAFSDLVHQLNSTLHSSGKSPIQESNATLLYLTVSFIMAFLIAAAGCAAIAIARQNQRRNTESLKSDLEANLDSSITEMSSGEFHELITIQEWRPEQQQQQVVIRKSAPINDAEEGLSIELQAQILLKQSKVIGLFEESRGFGDCCYAVDDENEHISFLNCADIEDEEEMSGWTTMDLVSAGVFKRTVDVLKRQPRCVLCSVCYKVGDKVSVSRNPLCAHQFHAECVHQWLKQNNSASCPICQR